jgi:hypothetical protein
LKDLLISLTVMSLLLEKTPSLAGVNGRKIADFSAQTYGVRAGGALITDKLFYFINYERQDNETPQPFDVSTYRAIWSRIGVKNQASYLWI